MRYYIECICRNCKSSFKVEIDETMYKETNRKWVEMHCYFHKCYYDEMEEHGIADPIAYCKEKDS